MDTPSLYVIAGPNGIGKTTSVYDFVPATIPVINSDEIADEIRRTRQFNVNTQEVANGKAFELKNDYLNQKESFGVKQTFAIQTHGNRCWKFRNLDIMFM